ncbi:MAG: hypothetical protein ACO3OL_02250, partial [bacterium]
CSVSPARRLSLCAVFLSPPVILRGAEGKVAETIFPESTLSLSVWGDRPQRLISLCERSKCPT